MRASRPRLAAALAAAAAAASLVAPAAPAVAGRVYHVATHGQDGRLRPGECPGGTVEAPWRTIEHGMRCLAPGDTLLVHGGTYTERVFPVTVPGRKDAPVLVQAYRGERVVVRGSIRLFDADHWTVDGISVTRDDQPYGSGEYLVKFVGGEGWTFSDGEVWNSVSYAALRIESHPDLPPTEPSGWRVAGSCIHDTARTHGPGEDHNVYIDTTLQAGGGVFERNIVFDAPNGNNLKLGHRPVSGEGTSHVVVRHNTFWNAVQNVLAAGDSSDNRVVRNIVGKVIRPAGKEWYPNVRGIDLDGAGNVAQDNLGADAGNMIFNDRESSRGWKDAGGNVHPVAPRFDSATSCAGFRPRTARAQAYGRYAPGTATDEPRPQPTIRAIDDACPQGHVPEDGFTDVPDDHPHETAIDCVVWRDIASGTSTRTYAPDRGVTRAQMATFVARLVEASGGRELPTDAPDRFRDDDGSPHEENIDRLAAAGIVAGVSSTQYGPSQTVTRAQMATFLVRAYEYASGATLTATADWFADDDASPHEGNIDRAASAGITGGTSPGRYSPGRAVTRGQMASFVARTLDLLLEA